jgi:hypothetical protein
MAEKGERFTLRVGEIYRTIETGLQAIDDALARTSRTRLANLPGDLLERWIPKSAKITKTEVFFRSEQQEQQIREKLNKPRLSSESAVLTSHWHQDFIGERLVMGEVLTDEGLWHVLYRPSGEVRRIVSNTDNKCNPCIWQKNFMMRFEGDHLYATVFDRIEGLKAIQEHAKTASVFRAVVIPPYLLKEIILPAKEGDYRFILSRRDPLAQFFSDDGDVRYASRAKIYYVYGEQESNIGSLRLDADYYSIFWRDNEIFNVMRLNNRICSNCLSRVFDTSWKYSEKV